MKYSNIDKEQKNNITQKPTNEIQHIFNIIPLNVSFLDSKCCVDFNIYILYFSVTLKIKISNSFSFALITHFLSYEFPFYSIFLSCHCFFELKTCIHDRNRQNTFPFPSLSFYRCMQQTNNCTAETTKHTKSTLQKPCNNFDIPTSEPSSSSPSSSLPSTTINSSSLPLCILSTLL